MLKIHFQLGVLILRLYVPSPCMMIAVLLQRSSLPTMEGIKEIKNNDKSHSKEMTMRLFLCVLPGIDMTLVLKSLPNNLYKCQFLFLSVPSEKKPPHQFSKTNECRGTIQSVLSHHNAYHVAKRQK